VSVVVDEPGYDGPAFEVDALRIRTREPSDIGIPSNRDEPVAADCNRFRNSELIVNGDEFTVREDDVRRGLLRLERRRARRESGHEKR
jgi:hypothetical protein